MAAKMSVVDIFGILQKRRPIHEIEEILEGRRPITPGESLWGWPIFRPTTGPSTGPASAGSRGRRPIPGGSRQRTPPGIYVGPPPE